MRAAVDCGEMDRGDVREEIVVGNACGGKPGSRGSWIASMIDPRSIHDRFHDRSSIAILLSHTEGVEPSP